MWRTTKRIGRRRLPESRLAGLLCALFLCLGLSAEAAVEFTASLDRDSTAVGEPVSLTLQFKGGAPGSLPALPQVPGLQYVGVSQSESTSFGPGGVVSTIAYIVTLVPQQAGDFAIPAITAQVNGQKLQSQPLKLKVLKPGAPSPDAINSGSQAAFLKLIVPRQELYLGEAIQAQLLLYLHDGVGCWRMQPKEFSAEGFNVSQVQQGAERNVQIGNAIYHIMAFDFTLKPVKTGRLSFGPVTAAVGLDLPIRGRRRDPLEEMGFPGMFSSRDRRQVSLATEATNLVVLPLPSQNVPPGFNGAVGNYTMNVSVGPTNLVAGDPITVRVQIAGRGALDSLVLPEQPAWRDFKTMAPTASPVEARDRFGLQGTRTFEQIVVPQSADVKELPPFSFSFFDPEAKAYRTLTQPAVPLAVRPAGSSPAPTVVTMNRAGADTPPPGQDIVHIKPFPGVLAQTGPPLAGRPWFLALQIVPVLVWLSAFVWRRRIEMLANNPRLRRRRQVAHIVRDGLVELRRLAADNKSDEFFATLFRLLQEQIGERLDLPASAITEAVIDEHLRPRGVPEAVLSPIRDLFQTCNLARYAPIKSSQELAAVIPRLEAALHALQEVAI